MKRVLLIFILSLLFLSGCITKENCTMDAKLCPDGSFVGRILPNCEFAPCPEPELVVCTQEAMICPDGSTVGRTGPNCEFTPCPPPTPRFNNIETIEEKFQDIETFTIHADDTALMPSKISVKKGNVIQLTFEVDEENVYYGGLDFRSDYFNTGTVLPGNRQMVEFIADESFEYKSYWPASNRLKATGKVNVEF